MGMKYRELNKQDKKLFATDFLETSLKEVGCCLLFVGCVGLIIALLIFAFMWKYGYIILLYLIISIYAGIKGWKRAVSNQNERKKWRAHLEDNETMIQEMRKQLELIDANKNIQINAGWQRYVVMDEKEKQKERDYYNNRLFQYEKEVELAKIKLKSLGEKIS